ncbi:MAG: L-lactate permease [Fusobacteriaceae bacterium]|jgi:lactate permease|nr:L-lactate permease [Fusobacteriaceae bacterium]
MFKFVLAISPILVVLIGMVVFNISGKYVAPFVAAYTVVLCVVCFKTTGAVPLTGAIILKNWLSGAIEGFKIFCLIWPAFVILKTMTSTGAIEKVKETLSGVTDDKRIQLIMIASMFVTFLEGAAGAGSPAAVAGPFLVALGINPVIAATVTLFGDATAASFGGAGLTTIRGSGALIEAGLITAKQSGIMVGRVHFWGLLVMPTIIIFTTYGKKGFKKFMPYWIFSSLSTPIILLLVTTFIGPEFGSLGTGALALIASIIFLKIVKMETPEEFKQTILLNADSNKYTKLQSFGSYILLSLALPIVRFTVPWWILTYYGYIVWVAVVIFLCSFFGAMILKVPIKEYLINVKTCGISLSPVFITIGALLVISNLMNTSGMIRIMAEDIAAISGNLYPAMASFIGALGGFITGTGVGSNIMFAPMHIIAAKQLGLNVIPVFAGQNAGASLGNLICPNNVIAAAATVGLIGREGDILKKALKIFFIIVIMYMSITMLYTHIFFKTWGV